MVAAGATYAEAGNALGLSRNAVAGACHRAGVRVGRKRPRNAAIERARADAIRNALRAWWAKKKHRVHRVQAADDIASIASNTASIASKDLVRT